jgi:hypothetical protein
VHEHRSGTRDHGELLWGLVNLELWHRIMVADEAGGRAQRGGTYSPPGVAFPT